MTRLIKNSAIFVSLCLSLASLPVNSQQNKTKSKPSIFDGEFDLKGAKIGDSKEKIASDFNANCTLNSCSIAYYPDGRTQNPMPADKERFAGLPALSYSFKFENDSLVEMLVEVESQNFVFSLAALSEKFGKPKAYAKNLVQNAYGAQYQNETVIWENNNGETIYIEKYFPDLKTSYVFLRKKDFLIEEAKKTPSRKGSI